MRDADTGALLAGAYVSAIGTAASAVTHGDGSFHLTGIAPGSYALRVQRLGYASRTLEVTIGDEGVFVPVDLVASPIALEGLIVTAALTERTTAEALRPVGVLAGQELQRRMTGTVAQTLASIPGLSSTSMGPAAARRSSGD